jgi:non-specific serine/threonine protein kinase
MLLAAIAAGQREYAQAEALLLDALALFRGLKKVGLDLANALNSLGEVARLQKAYERAAAYYQECLTHAEEDNFAVILFNLGLVAVRQGDRQRATALFRESVDRAGENKYGAYWNLWGFALAAAALGYPRRAVILYAAVERVFDGTRAWQYAEDKEDYAGDVASVREQLDEEEFAAAWAEGRAMSLEQAVAFALEEGDDQ